MKQVVLMTVVAGAVLAMVGLLLPAADDSKTKEKEAEPQTPVAKFMRAKLANSQSVLEGLVTEDYDLIRVGAQQMIVMSKAAEWNVYPGETYLQDSTEFTDAAKELISRAKSKNIDGATLSYLKLTMSCVKCHNHVRAVKVAAGEPVPAALENNNFLSSMRLKSSTGLAAD